MSYTAIITKVRVRPHPNADRLQLGTCLGNQVVVGLDTKDGELGIYFPTDGQLSERMCEANNLYTASARKQLDLSEATGGSVGFFDVKRRVRAQRFRQERSDGLWMPLSSLSWTGADPPTLKDGDTLVELGGYEVCRKYYTPATLRAIGNKLKRRDAKCFPKHDDTAQFRFVADQIPEDSIIYITEKLHGTSGRYGHVWDDLPQTPLTNQINRILTWLGLPLIPSKQGWVYLNGSKNVILEKADHRNSWYVTDDFRYNVVNGVTLHKGEVLYFEIVGWVNEQTPVMPPQDVTKTGLKDIREKYGDQMHYTYGCPRGTHRMYVYKIVQVNQDGIARELPWTQVVQRCNELGLPHVPLLDGPFIGDKHSSGNSLREVVEAYTEGSSTLDSTQIREGVVVRAESTRGITHIKNKQFAFGVLEGYLKQDSDMVDPEEAA